MEGSVYSINGYSPRIVAIAACGLSMLAGERSFAQVLKGPAAFGTWQDDKPGIRRLITLQDLPAISISINSGAQVVPVPAGVKPQLPNGFSAELVTSEIRNARAIRVAP